jgi:exosortase D (VPLPA-CTERM-specific)
VIKERERVLPGAGVLALIAAFLLIYGSMIPQLIQFWSRDDYSHGFLIPFISLYLVWIKRRSLRGVPAIPNILFGILTMGAAGALFLLGGIGGVVVIQTFSLIPMILGAVLLTGGMKYLKAFLLPVAYLVFMLPILDLLIERVHWPFQLFTAKLAGYGLAAIGIPVLQNSQYIQLPHITLEVADICSGIRYLVSIIALGIPLAYLTQKRNGLRIILIFGAVLIGIFSNGARVFFIGVWAHYFGGDSIHGPFHVFQGLFVSIFGFAVLLVGALLLKGIFVSEEERSSAPGFPKERLVIAPKRARWSWALAVAILLLVGGYTFLREAKPVSLKGVLEDFPEIIGEWKRTEAGEDKNLYPSLEADDGLIREYRDPQGTRLTLLIAYFQVQKQGKEIVDYRSRWIFDGAEERQVAKNSQEKMTIYKTVVFKNRREKYYYFWQDLNGTIAGRPYEAKWALVANGLLDNRTNGALIVVSPVADVRNNSGEAEERVFGFIRDLIPLLAKYLPE